MLRLLVAEIQRVHEPGPDDRLIVRRRIGRVVLAIGYGDRLDHWLDHHTYDPTVQRALGHGSLLELRPTRQWWCDAVLYTVLLRILDVPDSNPPPLALRRLRILAPILGGEATLEDRGLAARDLVRSAGTTSDDRVLRRLAVERAESWKPPGSARRGRPQGTNATRALRRASKVCSKAAGAVMAAPATPSALAACREAIDQLTEALDGAGANRTRRG